MSEKNASQDVKAFDIFLSYKSDDFDWVNTLRNDLQERGVRVWLDKNQIRPGDLFAQRWKTGLKRVTL